MTRLTEDTGARGEIYASAAILGVPIDIHDGDDWWVRDGIAHVGADFVGGGEPAGIVARTLLLLWESAREVRVAPARRARRLALAAGTPSLEPLLAALDRLLAAAELLAAMPSLRRPLAGSLSPATAAPGEGPRHLQFVAAIIDTVAARWASGEMRAPAYASALAPEVRFELARIDRLGGDSVDALLLAFSTNPKRTAMQRFERAYGLLAPAYEHLIAIDAAERGLDQARARGESASDPDEQDSDGETGMGASGEGGAADEGAEPGGEAVDATADEANEQARAGEGRESAEGADLFASEQAAFVSTVLATPLPAAGAWVEGLELPELATAVSNDTEAAPTRSDSTGGAGGSGPTALADYLAQTRSHAASIERVRDVWRQVVDERVAERRSFSRIPQAEGDMLDTRALVGLISDVVAGVERPRAFLQRERRPRRDRREGSTDYVLLIDRSASMQGPPAEAAATAALIMLESLAGVARDIAAEERALGIDLELHLRTALIVFDSVPHVVKPLAGALDDGARRGMHAAIHSPRGSTNDSAALAAAAAEFGLGGISGPAAGGVSRQRIAIVVSDGGTNDATAAAREMARLRAAGVTVFGIGVGSDDLATRYAPSGMRLNDPAELASVLQRLVTGAGLAL